MVEPSAFAAAAAPPDRARPTSITVVAWLVIASTVASAITSYSILATVPATDASLKQLMSEGLLPLPIQYALIVAGALVGLVSAFGWLGGLRWSRWLYVVWSVLSAGVGLATSPMRLLMLPGIVSVAVVVFFLFRPAANAYFTRGAAR